MNHNETMSREEIMRAIGEGDKYAGILLEDIEGKIDIALEDSDRLDRKINVVDSKLEDFRLETDRNFNLVFEEHQQIFEEMRAMRQGSEAKFKEVFEKFHAMDEKFSKRFDKLDQGGR